jgi:hypothetical protein
LRRSQARWVFVSPGRRANLKRNCLRPPIIVAPAMCRPKSDLQAKRPRTTGVGLEAERQISGNGKRKRTLDGHEVKRRSLTKSGQAKNVSGLSAQATYRLPRLVSLAAPRRTERLFQRSDPHARQGKQEAKKARHSRPCKSDLSQSRDADRRRGQLRPGRTRLARPDALSRGP